MKNWMLLISLIGVIVLGAGVTTWKSRNVSSTRNDPTKEARIANAGPVLVGVEDLMRKVEKYRHHRVRVEGVVSGVSPEHRTLGLIDCREFERCGVTTCAQLTLPVEWAGPMPKTEETVRVEGEVQETGGKLIFVAGGVEKVRREVSR